MEATRRRTNVIILGPHQPRWSESIGPQSPTRTWVPKKSASTNETRYTAASPLQYAYVVVALPPPAGSVSHDKFHTPRSMPISSPLKRITSERIVAIPSIKTYQNLAAPTEIPPRAAVAAEQQHDASEHAHEPAQHASEAIEDAAPILFKLYQANSEKKINIYQ